MRVYYLTTSSFPSTQPGPLQTIHTAAALASPESPVHLLYRDTGADPAEIFDHYDVEDNPHLHLHPLPAAYVEWLPGPVRSKLLWASFLLVVAVTSLLALRHQRPVFYARDSILGIWAGLLGRLSHARSVFEIHAMPGAFHENWTEITGDDPLPDWKVTFERRKTETALRWADGIVAIAENLKTDLEAAYDLPPITVAHDGASDHLLNDGEADGEAADGRDGDERDGAETEDADDRIVVGYIGSRFTEMRNVRAVIDAVERLPARYEALVIGGREADVATLRERAADAGVTDHVELTGYLPQEDALARLGESDVVVFPYRETAEKTNRSPLKLFDYMGVDAAVVAADIRPAREVLSTDTAAFFDPEDPAELADVIQELGADPDRRDALSTAAREQLESYTWAERGRRIRLFLDGV